MINFYQWDASSNSATMQRILKTYPVIVQPLQGLEENYQVKLKSVNYLITYEDGKNFKLFIKYLHFTFSMREKHVKIIFLCVLEIFIPLNNVLWSYSSYLPPEYLHCPPTMFPTDFISSFIIIAIIAILPHSISNEW